MKTGSKALLITLLLSLIISCQKEQKEILLFNGIKFHLSDNDILTDITRETRDIFFSYFEDDELQIPIYKYIENENYVMYIALPVNSSIEQIASNTLLPCNENSSALDTDNQTLYYRECNSGSDYITEYAQKIDDNLIYILAKTNSKQVQEDFLTKEKLSQRFTIK